MDRKTEITAEMSQNSGLQYVPFVFHEQNFANPRLMFCANVSCVVHKFGVPVITGLQYRSKLLVHLHVVVPCLCR